MSITELIAAGTIMLTAGALTAVQLTDAGHVVLHQYGVTCQDGLSDCATDGTGVFGPEADLAP